MITTTLARAQLRQAALAALQAASDRGDLLPGVTIDSPGDWNTPPERLPAILLRCGDENKTSMGKTVPNFTTSVALELSARLQAATADEAQDQIEQLGAQIEQVLFTDYALNSLVQQFARVQTATQVTADGRQHIGGILMRVTLEVFEVFQPAPTQALDSIGIHADLAAPFDPSGTYQPSTDAPPYQSTPAPRTTGPDGRDEGALDITIPQ